MEHKSYAQHTVMDTEQKLIYGVSRYTFNIKIITHTVDTLS